MTTEAPSLDQVSTTLSQLPEEHTLLLEKKPQPLIMCQMAPAETAMSFLTMV